MFRIYPSGFPQGRVSQNFRTLDGQLLLTIDMILDMGGRPLREANGIDLSSREVLLLDLDVKLKNLGMD